MTASIIEAAQAVVDAAVGTPTGVLVPQHVLDELAQAVDRADAERDEATGNYRTDPEWLRARAEYVDGGASDDPDEQWWVRHRAAGVMREIERRHEVRPK